MSTEYYLHHKNSKEIISLRDILKPDIYMNFISNFIYDKKNYRLRTLEILQDDSVDTYEEERIRIDLTDPKYENEEEYV